MFPVPGTNQKEVRLPDDHCPIHLEPFILYKKRDGSPNKRCLSCQRAQQRKGEWGWDSKFCRNGHRKTPLTFIFKYGRGRCITCRREAAARVRGKKRMNRQEKIASTLHRIEMARFAIEQEPLDWKNCMNTEEHKEEAEAVLKAMHRLGREPKKPNGWHTYHICSGLLREVTAVAHNGGTIAAITCPFCGDWFEAHVTPIRPMVPPDAGDGG